MCTRAPTRTNKQEETAFVVYSTVILWPLSVAYLRVAAVCYCRRAFPENARGSSTVHDADMPAKYPLLTTRTNFTDELHSGGRVLYNNLWTHVHTLTKTQKSFG